MHPRLPRGDTTRLRLFTGVTVLPLLDPVRVAEDYATLDVISGGAGRDDHRQGQHRGAVPGLRLHQRRPVGPQRRAVRAAAPPAARGARHWAGTYRPPLDRFTSRPRPLQEPIRVWHGSATSTRSTELAARFGDPLFSANVSGPLEQYRALVDDYRQRWADHGRGPGRRARRRRLGRAARPRATRRRAVEEFRPSYEAFQAYARAIGVPQQFSSLEDAIARGSYFVGSPQQVLEQIHRYHEAFGHEVQHVGDIGSLDDPVRRRSIELFAAEVLPVLHATFPDRLWSHVPTRRPPNPPDRHATRHHRPITQEEPHDHSTRHPTRRSAALEVLRRSPRLGAEIFGFDLDRSLDADRDRLRCAVSCRPQGPRVPRRRAVAGPAGRGGAASSTSRSTTRPRCATPTTASSTRTRSARRARPAAGTSAGCGASRCSASSRSSTRSCRRSAATRSGPTCRRPTTTCPIRSRSSSPRSACATTATPSTTPRAPRATPVADTTEHPLVLRQPAQRPPGPVPQHAGVGFTGVSAGGGRGAARLPGRARVAAEVPGPLRLGRRRLRAVGQPGDVARRRRRLRRRPAGLPQGHRRMTGHEIAPRVLDLVPIQRRRRPARRSPTRRPRPAHRGRRLPPLLGRRAPPQPRRRRHVAGARHLPRRRRDTSASGSAPAPCRWATTRRCRSSSSSASSTPCTPTASTSASAAPGSAARWRTAAGAHRAAHRTERGC